MDKKTGKPSHRGIKLQGQFGGPVPHISRLSEEKGKEKIFDFFETGFLCAALAILELTL